MKRDSLDMYDYIPEDLTAYLRYYGRHFNKKLFEFATSKMTKDDKPVQPVTKDQVKQLIAKYNVEIKNDILYDAEYIATMVRADFWGSSIEDEKHLILYVKDVLDDTDGYDGLVWNRWYADTVRKGIPIEWSDML